MSLAQQSESPVTTIPPQVRISNLSLRALFVGATDNALIQFLRYVVVGGLAFALDFSTLFLLTRFAGLHYLYSAVFAFLVGVTVNYFLSSAWVFRHRVVQNKTLEFAVFAVIGVVGLGLNEAGLWLLSSFLGLHYLWSKVLTAGLVFVWNFGARKLALFR